MLKYLYFAQVKLFRDRRIRKYTLLNSHKIPVENIILVILSIAY